MANWAARILERHGGDVVRRGRYGIHLQSGQRVAAFINAAPAHYMAGGEWRAIDTTLVRDAGRGMFHAPGLGLVIRDDGTALLGSYSQQTGRVGTLRGEDFTTRRDLTGGRVEGSRFIREAGIYRHELRVTRRGLQETLTLLAEPTLDDDDWLVIETALAGPLGQRPPPQGWDARRRPVAIGQHAIGGRLYTGVQGRALAGATYPVTIDPDIATETADGQVLGINATYATARGTASSSSVVNSDLTVGQQFVDPNYGVFRSFLKFDTNGIVAGSVVAVNLEMALSWDDSATDFDVQIVQADWAAHDPIGAGNRDAAFDLCLSADAEANIWRNTAGVSTNTVYASGDLDAEWLDTAGFTYYGLRSARDAANTTPEGLEYIILYSADAEEPDYTPTLVVTYEATEDAPQGADQYRRRWRWG